MFFILFWERAPEEGVLKRLRNADWSIFSILGPFLEFFMQLKD